MQRKNFQKKKPSTTNTTESTSNENEKTYTLFEDFKATLTTAWTLKSSDKNKVVLERSIKGSELAYLSIEISEDGEYFYKDADIKDKISKALSIKMRNADKHKSSAFKYYSSDCKVLKVGDHFYAWMLVFQDYADRANKTGKKVIYASGGIWEIQREIQFNMTTTPGGWAEEYSSIFKEILLSCRSNKIK